MDSKPLMAVIPAVYTDAFVTKLNAAGNTILYSTYLGGNDLDLAQSITVNTAGEAYVTGHTNSTNFPTNNAYRATLSGVLDGFGTKNLCQWERTALRHLYRWIRH